MVYQSEKKGAKAGRKPALARLVDRPPEEPPELTDAAEVKAYKMLLSALVNSPFCSISCTAALEQGARLKARIDRLRAQSAGLESDLVENREGRVPTLHPLLKALAAAESSYRQSLAALCLTPRAISSARLAAGEKLKVAPPTAPQAKGKASAKSSRLFKLLGVPGAKTHTG
jgi:transposase